MNRFMVIFDIVQGMHVFRIDGCSNIKHVKQIPSKVSNVQILAAMNEHYLLQYNMVHTCEANIAPRQQLTSSQFVPHSCQIIKMQAAVYLNDKCSHERLMSREKMGQDIIRYNSNRQKYPTSKYLTYQISLTIAYYIYHSYKNLS